MSDGKGTAADIVFAELYGRYYGPVHHFCRRRLADDLVDDAVAETFLTAWRHLDEVPTGDDALVWLYGVAFRVVGHLWRSALCRQRLEIRLLSIGRRAAVAADESVLDEEESRLVLAAAARLGDTDAEVLRLSAWEQLGIADIAAVLKIDPNAVKQRLHRARHNLGRETAGSKPVRFRPPLLPKEVPSDHRRRSAASVRTGRPGPDRRHRPAIDAAGYLEALRTRSSNVDYIDTEPTPTEPPTNRHRWLAAAAAAATVAVIAGGLVLAARDDDETGVVTAPRPAAEQPPVTEGPVTTPPPSTRPPLRRRGWVSSACPGGSDPEHPGGPRARCVDCRVRHTGLSWRDH